MCFIDFERINYANIFLRMLLLLQFYSSSAFVLKKNLMDEVTRASCIDTFETRKFVEYLGNFTKQKNKQVQLVE